MRTITGPFENIGRLVHDKAVRTRKVEKLQHMRKVIGAFVNDAYDMDYPILGDILLSATELAGNLAYLEENK